MGQPIPVYADVESLLVGWLASTFPGVTVATELPAAVDIAATLPLIHVAPIGGAPTDPVHTSATVDLDVYCEPDTAGGRSGAEVAADLALRVQGAVMFLLPNTALTPTATVKRVQTMTRPVAAPYADDETDIRRRTAAYTITVKGY